MPISNVACGLWEPISKGYEAVQGAWVAVDYERLGSAIAGPADCCSLYFSSWSRCSFFKYGFKDCLL